MERRLKLFSMLMIMLICSLLVACGDSEVTYDKLSESEKETIDFLIDHKNDWWKRNLQSLFGVTYEGNPAIMVRYLDQQDSLQTCVWENVITYDISKGSMECVDSKYKSMITYSYDKKSDQIVSSSVVYGNWGNKEDIKNELAKILYSKKQ